LEIECQNIVYANKVEKISPEVREYVRSELYWIAKRVRKLNPDLNYSDLRKFLNEMVSVSV
jgi:DNA-directed RNA polymerase subunit F